MIFGLNFTFLSKYWFYYMDGLKVTLAGILDFDPFQYSWCDHGHDPCAEL